MKITEKIYDITTGQETITEREETSFEIAARETLQENAKQFASLQAEAAIAKETAKAKLAALGLTTDDLKALGLGVN